MSDDEDELPDTPAPRVRAPSAQALAAVEAGVRDGELEAMQAFYASVPAVPESAASVPAPGPPSAPAPAVPGGADVAWDMQRRAYVWDDPESGAMLVWSDSQQAWLPDEEARPLRPTLNDALAHLGDDFELEPSSEEAQAPPHKKENPVKSSDADIDAGAATKNKKKKKTKKRKTINSSVYVTGLPPDVTQDEMVDFFKKAGIIEKDPLTLQPKVKIYTDEKGSPKGDGLVTYLMPLALENAYTVLDGADFRLGQGYTIKLQEPEFDASKAKSKGKPAHVRLSKKQRRYDQSKELAWDDEEHTHVVLKHVFDADEARRHVHFYDNLKAELEPELAKCGPVVSVKIFERNPEGVVAVKFEESWAAERCIEVMDGRFFDGRQLKAHYYDGYTNYFVEETEEERQERDRQWAKWLEGNDENEERDVHSGA